MCLNSYPQLGCAPMNVQVSCFSDRVEVTFPATAVGGSQDKSFIPTFGEIACNLFL